jgi:hypothetical protein
MTISDIFATFTAGSTGFCRAVATHCGFDASQTEIERIALRAAEEGPNSDDMAAEFERIWEEEFWWTDAAA